MQQLTARFAGAFMLTLAAVPLAAGAASVAQAVPAVIRVADLDLTTAKGRTAFDQRTERAARQVCAGLRGGRIRDTACEAAVKREAADKLAAARQTYRASL
jgi:UrcA family protein